MATQIIENHIDSLKQNSPHITNIRKIDQYCYRLTYTPTQSTSVYRDKIFQLQLTLTQKYPENPPSLRFIDPIYHLNVDKSNGNINMSILMEQWSPFLTITSLIQNLDCLMQQPQIKYPASLQLLQLIQNNKQQYLTNVFNSFQRSFQQPSYIMVKEQLDINKMGESFEQLQNPVQQIQQIKEQKIVQTQEIPKIVIKQQREKQKQKKQRKEFSYKNSPYDNVKNKNQSYQMQEHENMKNTYLKINSMINMEMQAINQLSKQLKIQDLSCSEIRDMLRQRKDQKLQELKRLKKVQEQLKLKMMKSIEKYVSLYD